MDTELIQWFGKVAGLGGLALGVFLLLFREIIRKQIYPTLTKRHAFQLLSLITILVWSVALAGLGAWVWTENARSKLIAAGDLNGVHEEYTRLFGQGGVPALMALQESKGRYLERNGQYIVDLNRDVFPISKDAISFWQDDWPYKNATPLLNTTLWDRYSGKREYFYWIDTFMRLHDGVLLACYLVDIANAGFSSVAEDTEYFKKIKQCPKDDWPPRVGFTFVTIRNDTGHVISNVEISYKIVEAHPTIAEVFERTMSVTSFAQLVSATQDTDGLNRFLSGPNGKMTEDKFLSDNLVTAAVVEQRKDSLNEVRKVSTMNPGESVIFLINVYLPGQTSLPLYFLDDALFLTSIGYNVEGQRVSRPARQPAGESAARKQLPWGWYSQ